ncbi:MAG: SgcJ/EcaC family oxidoreductase [Lentisphaerae bacterium]|nr:SgcJ/EcaC family oxidoreductase [Lentisphaerota bacterium]MBT4817606.1 SgcJ/EcaC family oxidoreductase [Lentisphaerota bacterium]MBT5612595.1 SgcJ/EcaC family oxidoreductase [Lentisphaerota bacterium]MBT7055697.1 SgcJ/EcaC family oxidoreductase [Lentisphaerota bacterium]MBT7845815.1 SgcJ/EcaC family oxidoreductase [Lentisphaerota bacterium]
MPAHRPEECDQLLFKTIDTGDLDAALELYEPDAVFVVAPGQVVTGHAAIREVLRGMLAAGGVGNIEGVTSVVSTDGSVAFTRTKGSATHAGPDGKPVTVEFHSVEVVRKQPDGTWRIAIDDPSGMGLA